VIRRQRVKSLLLVLLALVPLASARAQDAESEPYYQPTAKDKQLLFEREKSRIHPGDPMRIIGLEQEGNDIRSRTSALTRNTAGPRGMSDDENYRRQLALYGDRAKFDRPPTPVALEVASLDVAPQRPAMPVLLSEETVPESSGNSNLLLGLAIAVVLISALVVWWRRGMPVDSTN
jgi:hypothetical protein